MKVYSMVIKGQRIDFTDADLEQIKKGTTLTEAGNKIVHLFSKAGRVDVPKAEFDAQFAKLSETPKAE